MKKTGYILLISLLILILGFVLLTASAVQEQTDSSQGILETEEGETRISENKNAYRSTNIVGSEIQNNQGESLGSIEDLVIDIENGEILYAVMSSGGLLGVGAELFAVPWDELEPRSEEGIFMLDISQERLEETEGLSEGNWPGIGDRQWGEGDQQEQQEQPE